MFYYFEEIILFKNFIKNIKIIQSFFNLKKKLFEIKNFESN